MSTTQHGFGGDYVRLVERATWAWLNFKIESPWEES